MIEFDCVLGLAEDASAVWSVRGNAAANKSLERIFGDWGFLESFGVHEMGLADGVHGANSKPFSSALTSLWSVESVEW